MSPFNEIIELFIIAALFATLLRYIQWLFRG